MNTVITLPNDVYALTEEEISISKLQQGKTRMSIFNDSYRKRYLDYIKILVVIAVGLACLWTIIVLENMEIIPNYMNNVLTVGIVSVTAITCHIIYKAIRKHDLLNYDELSIKSPDLVTPDPKKTSSSSSSSLDTGTTGTTNSNEKCNLSIPKPDMCGSGTIYDSVTNKCVSGAMNLFQ
jgi:hypothetical protein